MYESKNVQVSWVSGKKRKKNFSLYMLFSSHLSFLILAVFFSQLCFCKHTTRDFTRKTYTDINFIQSTCSMGIIPVRSASVISLFLFGPEYMRIWCLCCLFSSASTSLYSTPTDRSVWRHHLNHKHTWLCSSCPLQHTLQGNVVFTVSQPASVLSANWISSWL